MLPDSTPGPIPGRNVIILLGGPGAGKGTQADLIAARLKIPHISTGQLLRAEVAAETDMGLRVRAVIDAGNLVGDDIVNDLVQRRIDHDDCIDGFILDGFPRDVGQAVTFNESLTASDHLVAIDIETDLEQVLTRLTGRRTCESCQAIYHVVSSPPRRSGFCDVCGNRLMQRSDDREEVIRERFRTYRAATEPLTGLYKQWGVYHGVDGMQAPADVARSICCVLAESLPQAPAGSRVA
jgi:adenylate kinase